MMMMMMMMLCCLCLLQIICHCTETMLFVNASVIINTGRNSRSTATRTYVIKNVIFFESRRHGKFLIFIIFRLPACVSCWVESFKLHTADEFSLKTLIAQYSVCIKTGENTFIRTILLLQYYYYYTMFQKKHPLILLTKSW